MSRLRRATSPSQHCRKLASMLTVGDQVPDATVWFAPRETVSLRDVVEDRPALFLFYLFDWSST
jgi:peroxiredoxin